MTGNHPLAAKAQEVIRLAGHVPEKFTITTDAPEAGVALIGVVVARKETGRRRTYAANGPGDWAFELETDLKGGYFGPT